MALAIQVLGSTAYEKWCHRCLVTTPWIVVFLRVGTNGQAKRACQRCEGKRPIIVGPD